MNKFWLTLIVATVVLASFSGCAKKKNGDTNVNDLDESLSYDSAVADNGYRVTGSLGGTATALKTGADGSATSLKVSDQSPDDASGTTDLADFLLDAKEADGSRVQAELRSMTSGSDVGQGEFFGGVLHNEQINGDTGIGSSDLPETKAYILLQGLARVKENNETIEDLLVVQVAVTKGIRGSDQALLSAAEDDLEVHVLFPEFTGSADGFRYYYFENVKLEQLEPTAKADVGSKLQEPAKPNVPPIASAAVVANGTATTMAEFDPDTKFLNVTLDASNSTDSDGQIEAYSWDVKEFNSNGTLVPLNKTSGQTANFSFTSGGTKIVSLRIIDDDGGIANTTIFFFVNTKKTYSFAFTGLAAVGANPDGCSLALNCKDHSATVFWGAQRLTTTAVTSSPTSCNGPHQDLYAPGTNRDSGDPVASGNPLNVTAESLVAAGKYNIDVWFTSQASCSYSFVLSVSYVPEAGTATDDEVDA